MFIWKTNFTFIFFVDFFIIIILGLHIFNTCLTCSILECCYSAVAVIQRLFCFQEINVDLTSRVHCKQHFLSRSMSLWDFEELESLNLLLSFLVIVMQFFLYFQYRSTYATTTSLLSVCRDHRKEWFALMAWTMKWLWKMKVSVVHHWRTEPRQTARLHVWYVLSGS